MYVCVCVCVRVCVCVYMYMAGFPCSSVGKEPACNAGDLGLIPGSGRSPAEGNGNPLQYSCLENPMDRGAWQATVHGVTRVGHDLVTKQPLYIWHFFQFSSHLAHGRLKICSVFYPVLLFFICNSFFFPLSFLSAIDTLPFIKLCFSILTHSRSCLSLLSPGEKAWSRWLVTGSKGNGSEREALGSETS